MKVFEKIFALAGLTSIIFSCNTTKNYTNENWKKNGITSLEKIKLCGLNHSVLIRGTNVKENSILLFIHGQAAPSMPFAHLEYPETGDKMELLFTVVHYDQRGVCKTAALNIAPNKSVNLEQYIKDAEELIENLRKRFDNKKIVLLCESFGSIIGINLAYRHPEWFLGYIGAGQMSDIPEYLNDIYQFTLDFAEKNSEQNALKQLKTLKTTNNKLEVMGLNRRQYSKMFSIIGRWLDKFYLKLYTPSENPVADMLKNIAVSPEGGLWDLIIFMNTYFSIYSKLGWIVLKVNLNDNIKDLKIPVYIIQGEFDVANRQAKIFFDNLSAPKKEYIIIKDAGHIVRGEKSEEFNEILFNKIYNELKEF